MAACDADNHVLLFKHSVVDAQLSASAEEVYVANEVGATWMLSSECEDTVVRSPLWGDIARVAFGNHAR